MKYLKQIRRVLSMLFFLPILLFFIDFTGTLPEKFHAIIKLQWIPALLSINLILIGILLLLSLLFGRIYCSTICPLGILQDVVSWKSKFFKKKKKKKKYRYSYSKPQNILRYTLLALTIILFIFGSSFLLILLDPYSIFGRFGSQLFQPSAIWINNQLATIMNGMGNYTLYRVEQVGFVPLAFAISISFFIGIAIMSWLKGRLFCNTVCPVGTTLGLLSRFSIFNISFDKTSCNQCGSCEKTCKSGCIDSKHMTVDDSRCVSCYNCLSVCKKSAINYKFRYAKPTNNPNLSTNAATKANNRRTFLLTSGAIATSLAFANTKKVLHKNDSILSRKPIMPPGANTLEHFNTHCTACQLCVTKCPMKVLQPAVFQYGLSGIMQPHLAFSTHVFCTFECNICTTVCPTNALTKITIDEKRQAQIGIANFRKDMCVVYTDETDCGACSEHCPTQAVHMIPYKNGLTIPEVTDDLCIGCGGCESICPVRPHPAIYVEGVSTQLQARKPKEAEIFDEVIDDFGF